MVELDPELMVDGVNDATAPEGRPLALWTRCGVVPVDAVTVRMKAVEWVADTPVPVTVTG